MLTYNERIELREKLTNGEISLELQSDYFAKKKGQLVFVGETMVKGKAKTVSMSPKTDEFMNSVFGTKS